MKKNRFIAKNFRIFVKNNIDMLQVKTFEFNALSENSYLIRDEKGRCIAVDPSFTTEAEAVKFIDAIGNDRLDFILLTHAHFDHIWGVAPLLERFPDAAVYMNANEEYTLSQNAALCAAFGVPVPQSFDFQAAPAEILWNDRKIKVIETPGHTKGGTSYFFEDDKILFTGDTLFAGTIGRSDLPGGDYDALMRSVWSLMDNVGSDVDVLPGHGPSTSIGREATTNPMLIPIDGE